jgi:hypothetical protein
VGRGEVSRRFTPGGIPEGRIMLVPRSQIEQTAEAASTLISMFEAPSI